LVRGFWRGGEVIFLIFMFGSIFYEGEGRGGNIEQFLLPPKLGGFEGEGREAL
jgi:hypothetical protein